MTLTRLLVMALLVCSYPAFAQDYLTGMTQIPGSGISSSATKGAAAAPSEAWRILPNPPADFGFDETDHIRIDQYRPDQPSLQAKTQTLVMNSDGQSDADTTCYAIRSYVVARDSKDSDSTHMTGYSTCRPASNYRLKTTEDHPRMEER